MEFFYSLGLMAGIFRYITLIVFGSHEMIRITFFIGTMGMSQCPVIDWATQDAFKGKTRIVTQQNNTLWEMREHLKCSIKSTYHNFIRHKMDFFLEFFKILSDAKLWNIWLDVDLRLLFCSLFDARLYFNSHIVFFHLSCFVNVICQQWQLKKETT